jgi:hypothetical protein
MQEEVGLDWAAVAVTHEYGIRTLLWRYVIPRGSYLHCVT